MIGPVTTIRARYASPNGSHLRGSPSVVAAEDSHALLDTFTRYLGFLYAFVGEMLVFGAVIAFALLCNATP